ncbi:MAG: DUF975 family protein [Defluviitaleaceae bacterium]|nr:DUF975 family protein [Defluviitaleaceae bacterium]MCL2836426.1 DUF975 family protein [Defluviitaleaceae bacterium]
MRLIINRAELKGRARRVLKSYYWLLFVVSLVAVLFGGSGNGSGSNSRNTRSGGSSSESAIVRINDVTIVGFDGVRELSRTDWNRVAGFNTAHVNTNVNNVRHMFIWGILAASLFGIVMFAGFMGLAFRILVSFPLKVGCWKIFVNTAGGTRRPNLREMLYAFRSGRYVNIALAGFLTGLYTLLWTLLFVIPGIVKTYAYRMVPYILAENPDMNASDAIRLSMAMTNGHKWDMFVLDLSFIGWYLLGMLALGFGIFFVHPYKDATFAQLYLELRDISIHHKIAMPANFGLHSHTPENPLQNSPVDNGIVDYRDKPFND